MRYIALKRDSLEPALRNIVLRRTDRSGDYDGAEKIKAQKRAEKPLLSVSTSSQVR